MSLIHYAIHLFLVMTMPPLILGIIAKTKAVFAGRAGPSVFQPYYNISKLLRKGSLFSKTTTWVFQVGPVVMLVTAFFAVLLVPLGGDKAPLSFEGDCIFFVYLLGLGRFFTIAAAWDTGSSFQGMGAAREATFSCLAEPALILGLVVLAYFSSSLSLSSLMGPSLSQAWTTGGVALILVVVSLFIVVLAENSRIPVDDPNTHLELTMIHEVMVLDHGGPALGIINLASALKLFTLGSIIVRIATPFALNPVWKWGFFVLGIIALAIVIGVVESIMARLRMTQVPILLVAASLLSAFGIVLVAR